MQRNHIVVTEDSEVPQTGQEQNYSKHQNQSNTTNLPLNSGTVSSPIEIPKSSLDNSADQHQVLPEENLETDGKSSGDNCNKIEATSSSFTESIDSDFVGKEVISCYSSDSDLTEVSDNFTDSALPDIDLDFESDKQKTNMDSGANNYDRNTTMDEAQRMERWLDSHPHFLLSYINRKKMIPSLSDSARLDSQLSRELSEPGSSNYGLFDSRVPQVNPTVESASNSRASSGTTTPVRRISTQEFDRSGQLLTRMVQTIGGVPSFISPAADSRKGSGASLSPTSVALSDKSLSELKALDEHQFMHELIMDICKDLDIRRLCHKILKNVCLLLGADRCSLFLVQQSHNTSSIRDKLKQEELEMKNSNNTSDSAENSEPKRVDHSEMNGGSERCLVSTLFDVSAGSSLQEELRETQEIRVPMGTGIVGYVAETGEGLNISDAYQDERFNKEVDRLTGFRTRSILCMPVLDARGQVIAVAQAINKTSSEDEPFSEQDEKIFKSYLAFCGIGIHNAQMFERSTLENRRNQLMLDLAWVIFEEQRDVATLINKILFHTLSLLRCERCQLLLVDESNPMKFSQAFDIQCSDLEQDNNYFRERSLEPRFPVNMGIVTYVSTTGGTEEDSDFRSRTILCMPIKNAKGHVIGVVQLTNKMDDTAFNRNDENLFEAFAIFCGMGINNTRMYEQALKAMARQRVVVEVLSYHSTATQEEVQRLKKSITTPIPARINLSDYRFDDAWLNDDGTLKACYLMFQDLRLIEKFRIPYDVFLRWMLTVKKNYRSVAYHNWRHAFNVTQTMYVMMQSKKMKGVLNDLEVLALMVGCLSHDLDHRGTNNQFQVKSTSPLADLYSTSILEWHHYEHCIRILQTKGTEIFCNLTEEDNVSITSMLKEAILATDLSLYFKHRDEFFRAVDTETANSGSWTNTGYRSLLRELSCTMTLNCYRPVGKTLNCYLRQKRHPALKNLPHSQHVNNLFVDLIDETFLPSFTGNISDKTPVCVPVYFRGMMMTACDLSAITKPWKIQKKVAYLLADEFFEQGDIEKSELHIKPMDMMDRDNTSKLPSMQIGFIDGICMPIYKAFAKISDDYEEMLAGCQSNRDCWSDLSNGLRPRVELETNQRNGHNDDDDDVYSTAV